MKKIAHVTPLRFALVAIAVLAIACTSDSPNEGPYDLTFNGSGYVAHNSQTLRAALFAADGTLVAGPDATQVSAGAFSFSWPFALIEGSSYEVRLYADFNGNGHCNASPTDHSWVVNVAGVTQDTVLDEQHNLNFSYVCTSFGQRNLGFSGAGYSAHIGQTLIAAVLLASDDSVVAGPEQTTVDANADFSFSWDSVLVDGQDYALVFYADFNQSASCDAPPTDLAWRVDIATVSANEQVDENHNLDFTDVCGFFP